MSEMQEIKNLLVELIDRVESAEKSAVPKVDKDLERALQKLDKKLQKKDLIRVGELTRSKPVRLKLLAELQKRPGLLVIHQDNTTYIIRLEKTSQAKQTPQRATQVRVVGLNKLKKAKRMTQKQKLIVIRNELAKGKSLTILDIRALGIGGNVHLLMHKHLTPSRWAKVTKKSGVFIIEPTKRTSTVALPRMMTKPKPQRKKSAYNFFLGKQVPKYVKLGYNNSDAFRLAIADWNSYGKQKSRSDAKPRFPKFESVENQFIPILKGVIEGCIKGKRINFAGVSYALNLKTEAEFRQFIDDMIVNNKDLKTYFSVSQGSFRWDGQTMIFK